MPVSRCEQCDVLLLPEEAAGPSCPACQAPRVNADPAPPPSEAPAPPAGRSFGLGVAVGALLGLTACGVAWLAWPVGQPTAGDNTPPAAPNEELRQANEATAAVEAALRNAQARIQAAERATAEGRAELARMRERAEAAEKKALARNLEEEKKPRGPAQPPVGREAPRTTPKWEPVEVLRGTARSGATLERQKDGSVFVSGKKGGGNEVYTVAVRSGLTGITGFRLEALPDDRLPVHGPGRSPGGNFVLNELRVAVADVKTGKLVAVPLHRAWASFAQDGLPPGNVIDGNPATGWAIAPEVGKAHEVVFQTRAPLTVPAGAVLVFTLEQRYGGDHTIGKFRLSATTSKGPLSPAVE